MCYTLTNIFAWSTFMKTIVCFSLVFSYSKWPSIYTLILIHCHQYHKLPTTLCFIILGTSLIQLLESVPWRIGQFFTDIDRSLSLCIWCLYQCGSLHLNTRMSSIKLCWQLAIWLPTMKYLLPTSNTRSLVVKIVSRRIEEIRINIQQIHLARWVEGLLGTSKALNITWENEQRER